jgi:HK97 family phage portal protein
MGLLQKMAGMLFRPSDHEIRSLFRGASETGEAITDRSAMQISAVWACVNLISGSISSLPLRVMQDGRNGVSAEVTQHPLVGVLQHSPNYDQTALDFLDYLSSAIELRGDGMAYKIRGTRGQIIGLEPMNPDSVSRRRLANGRIEYAWTKDNRRFVETEENVLHIRGPGGEPLGGMSTLSFAADAFGVARAAERSQARIFRNGMRNSVIVSFKRWLTAEQREIAQTKFMERFTGIESSGKPVILEGDTDVKPLTISPVDAEMLATRAFSIEEIARFFAVPPVMIGHTSKTTSWPTGVEQQVLMFLKFTLRRRLKRIETAMEKQLLTPAEYARGLKIRFNLEGLLRADSAGRSAFYGSALEHGWMTINEVRALEGLQPVEGGEVPRMQMQNVPITQAGQEPAQITDGDDDGE